MPDDLNLDETLPPERLPAEDQIAIDAGIQSPQVAEQPSAPYKVIGDAKVPVSKATGKLWNSRKELGRKALNMVKQSWEEAANYYSNEQYSEGRSEIPENFRNTENIVFSNTTTMLPAVYTKNPEVTFTSQTGFEDDEFLAVLKRLMNVLLGKNHLNLKNKIRKMCLWTLLTNESYLKLEWIEKEFSTDEVFEELKALAAEFEKAEDEKQIKEIEGKLMALEGTFDVLSASGAKLSTRTPHEITVDPSCQEIDLSDANWLMDETYLPTTFLRARYMDKEEGSEEYKLIYKPTHTCQGDDGEETQGKNKGGIRYLDYVSKGNEDMYDPSFYTQVVFVWDKVTRRVFLYNTKQMTWPIWVWSDPLEISRFFPYFLLQFYPALSGIHAKGEVSYYLDHQDTINIKNAAERKVLDWVTNRWTYDKNKLTQDEADKILSQEGKGVTAIGLDLPEGTKAQDLFSPILPPVAQHLQLLDKTKDFKAVDRLSAVSDALRGAQFTANTTNDAVQLYDQASKLRVGEKTDLIEDLLEDFVRALCEICVSKMDQEQIKAILNDQDAQKWKQMTVKEFNASVSVSISVGSTQKPNSAYKQERAIKIGQVLGQFAQAAPGAVIKIILKMYENAFDEVSITREDWKAIEQSIAMMEQQKMGAAQGGAPADPNAPAGAPGSPTLDPNMIKGLLSFVLQLLPPELKNKLNEALQTGADPMQAIMQIAQEMTQ